MLLLNSPNETTDTKMSESEVTQTQVLPQLKDRLVFRRWVIKLCLIAIATGLGMIWMMRVYPSATENAWEDQDANVNSGPPPQPEMISWDRSIDGLRYLAGQEFQLYSQLNSFKAELKKRMKLMKWWIDDFESSSLILAMYLKDPNEIKDEVSGHPLMILRMIRRYVKLQRELFHIETMEPRIGEVVYQFLSHVEDHYNLPTKLDYGDVLHNIINIAYVYDLNETDLMKGKIHGVQTLVGLTPQHGLDIAKYAEETKAFSVALTWFERLRELAFASPNLKVRGLPSLAKLESDIERVSRKHDELLDEINDSNYWNFKHRFVDKILKGDAKDKRVTLKKYLTTSYSGMYDTLNYEQACSGQRLLSEKQKANLNCYLESKLHPRWRIGPLKIEIHSWDPYVIQIYDAYTEREIQYLQNVSKPLLKVSRVINASYDPSGPEEERTSLSKSRIALTTFILERSSILKNLEIKLGHMTGLEVFNPEGFKVGKRSSEGQQVGQYAPCGHYEYHHDLLEGPHVTADGKRIATILLYMNEVKLGGETAFPKIGIKVKPVKRSVVFWYNMYRNGNKDDRTLHGGCPILLGHKWVTNVWILDNANFLKRQCSLNQFE